MSADGIQTPNTLAGFRIGSVPYLNSVPLTYGIEDQIIFAPPSQLAGMLENETLDAALVSITEALLHPGYVILDNVAVASDGPVLSVFLATKIPLESVKVVHCDPASLTSINLLKVLLREKGIHPQWQPLADYADAPGKDAVLLIGDPAIAFSQTEHPHEILDLGGAWKELTGLPFVFAVWAIREECDNPDLLKALTLAKVEGVSHLPFLIERESRFDAGFRNDYLGKAIRYDLGAREKSGIQCFIEHMAKGSDHPVYPPKFVWPEPPKD
ncbi:MAG: menaquinone biosynthesis protein [Verrucomicrobia bacterium]|jgi:chorismate dehydratase|nr:menaquinone biosynthesis protein [Verrucomicrobiota bacterium]